MSRSLIVVDIETTGLKPHHVPLEIAAVKLTSVGSIEGKPFYMAPYINSDSMSNAEPDALRINRYYERGIYKQMLASPSENSSCYKDLHFMLEGNVLAGSNPRFDGGKLSKEFIKLGLSPEPWHHRLADLSAYAAGILNIPLTELPGLEKVCELLDVENSEPHGALSDTFATAACFRSLIARSALRDGRFLVGPQK